MTASSKTANVARRIVLVYAFPAATFVLLAACSGSRSGEDELVIGKAYSGSISTGTSATQVPLPEGKWILAGWEVYANDQELGGVLIEADGRHVARLVDFYVQYSTQRMRYLRHRPYKLCSRKDVIYMGKSLSGSTGEYIAFKKGNTQACWGINHWPMTLSGSIPKHLRQLRDYVEKEELIMPDTMLAVQYRRGGNGDYFSLNYYFNPELEGFAPPRQSDWRTSDWHRDRYSRDPKKKAYIERLKKWGAEWYSQVDKGFRGRLKRGGS